MNNLFKSGNDVIELTIKDYTGRKINLTRANSSDEEEVARIFKEVFDKYAFSKFKISRLFEAEEIKW
jgi:hypothetical protein